MNKRLFLLLLFITFTSVSAQTYERNPGETAQEFVNRIKPTDRDLIHPVIETTWNSESGRKNIFAFWYEDHVNYNNYPVTLAVGKLLVPIDKNTYKMITIDKVSENGGVANILSVFFVDSDKDGKYELGILYSWNYRHYMMSGTYYAAAIYDNIDYQNLPDCLFCMENIWGRATGTNDREEEMQASFTTAADVKSLLRKRGPAKEEDLNFIKEFDGKLGDKEITVQIKKSGSSLYGSAWNNQTGEPLQVIGSQSDEKKEIINLFVSDKKSGSEFSVNGTLRNNTFTGTCENKKTGKKESITLKDIQKSFSDMGCDWQLW